MKSKDELNREAAKKHVQESAKCLFGHRTEEQNKALRNIKTIGSPKNTIKTDSELFEDDVKNSLSLLVPCITPSD